MAQRSGPLIIILFCLACAPPSPATSCETSSDCPDGYQCDHLQLCVVKDDQPDAGGRDRILAADASDPDVLVVVLDASVADSSSFDGVCPDTFTPDAPVGDSTPLCVPTGPEITFLGDDNCADGQDNNCDTLTDEEAWECQDRDLDGIPNAVDLIHVPQIGSAYASTVCLLANHAFDPVWQAMPAIRQGTPVGEFGGFGSLDPALSDPVQNIAGAPSGYREWCFDFTGSPGNDYQYRYVASSGLDGQSSVITDDCNDWVRSDLSLFCSFYQDDFCYTQLVLSDGCQDVGAVIGVHWSSAGELNHL